MSITPKRWSEFQHYKDRSPAWIKLHRKLLDDFVFSRLPLASRALAPMLWLLAAEYEGGKITASIDEMAFRLRVSDEELSSALKPLIDSGFFIDDSIPLADCKQVSIPEREKEREKETERKMAQEAPTNAESDLFRRGREVVGESGGGLIAKLLKSKKGDVALARAAIEMASTKNRPREYLGAIIAGGQPSESGKRISNDEAYYGRDRIPGII